MTSEEMIWRIQDRQSLTGQLARRLKTELNRLPSDNQRGGLGGASPVEGWPVANGVRRFAVDGSSDETELLLESLLAEYSGASLLDVFAGEVRRTDHGEVLTLNSEHACPAIPVDACASESALLAAVRLLRGVGPVNESRLRQAGCCSITELRDDPRWGADARTVLELLSRHDLPALHRMALRWFSASDPLTLSLVGLADRERLAFLDIETMGTMGEPVVIVGIGWVEGHRFRVEQMVLREIADEPALLAAAADRLGAAEAFVTYNGRAFDVNHLKQRLSYYGLSRRLDHPNFDLLYFARRQLRDALPDCSLGTVEREMLGVKRVLDVDGALVPSFYHAYRQERNIGPLVAIIGHNRQDLVSLAILLGWLCAKMCV